MTNEESSITSWVIENRKQLPSFTRKKIASYSKPYQKAILSELSPKKKKELWGQKVKYLLNLKLSKEEKEYLSWYAEIFKKIDYTEKTSKDLENQLYKKTNEAVEKFGWSKKFIYQAFFSLEDIDLNGVDYEISRVVEPSVSDCDCMYDWGCPGWNGNCFIKDCEEPEDNCGFFGNSQCEGSCKQN